MRITTVFFILVTATSASCPKKQDVFTSFMDKIKSIYSKPIFKPQEDNLLLKIKKMSLEEKVAQLMIVRIESLDPIEELLDVFIPGGLIYTTKYPDSSGDYRPVIKKLEQLQSISKKQVGLPFLMMVDEEGGQVSRFLSPSSAKAKADLFIDLASPRSMAHSKDLALVEDLALKLGQVLITLGFNMNLAPVVDVSPEEKSFIGSRSFSGDPTVVRIMSAAFVKGMKRAGVITTFKHFPGYGVNTNDSHKQIVIIDKAREELLNHDLIPYQLTQISPEVIMSNIAIYSKIDGSSTGTLSKKIITGLLKTEIGFKGLVISDDLGMKGYKEKSQHQRAVRAIDAGHDMIMFTAFPKNQSIIEVYKYLVQAFKTGRLDQSRLEASLLSIVKLKSKIKSSIKPNSEKHYSHFLEKLSQLQQVNKAVLQTAE